jgi:hypothetical protein
MRVRIVGSDSIPLAETDLRRLFPDGLLSFDRFERLTMWPRVVAACGPRVVGVAAYQRVDRELRVPEIGVDASGECDAWDIVGALVEALEIACLAGGCRRVLIMPPPVGAGLLLRRGYQRASEGGSGSWMAKSFV